MHKVLIFGAGKIGSTIAFLFAQSHDYTVYLADNQKTNSQTAHLNELNHLNQVYLDANNPAAIDEFLKEHPVDAIISSLPYYCNIPIATLAAKHHLHYFDLTEDVETTKAIQALAQNHSNAFIPQCGLAPGFINIVAHSLMQHFSTRDIVKLRVGALPSHVSNALQYSLTWSTEGLINQYGNPCYAIEQGELVELQPLEGLEEMEIDGVMYEAFNTSGGIGSLAETYVSKVKQLSYKTIRYPGHCEKMKFLMNDLKLNDDRETLKRILENAIPKTMDDVVIVYVTVNGKKEGQFIEDNFVRKFYPKKIHSFDWAAIQLSTASALCAVVDLVLKQPDNYHGLIRQEQFSLNDILTNRFGEYYQ